VAVTHAKSREKSAKEKQENNKKKRNVMEEVSGSHMKTRKPRGKKRRTKNYTPHPEYSILLNHSSILN